MAGACGQHQPDPPTSGASQMACEADNFDAIEFATSGASQMTCEAAEFGATEFATSGAAQTTCAAAEFDATEFGAAEAKGDRHLEHLKEALRRPHPWASNEVQLPDRVMAAVERSSKYSVEDLIKKREQTITELESRAHELWQTGAVQEWLSSADDVAGSISARVNGPLLEELARRTQFRDPAAVDLLRFGGTVVGDFPATGLLEQSEWPEPMRIQELWSDAASANGKLLSDLREDKHASWLSAQAEKDASLGRMSPTLDARALDLGDVVISERFSREQGAKEDGSPKLRAIDNCTKSQVNPCARPCERLVCDRIDALVRLVQVTAAATGGRLIELWKADVDAAYRRIPVDPKQRDLLWVAWMHGGVARVARHNVMPFGSTGSVFAWDRVVALLAHLARELLDLPVLRYVEDFFSATRQGEAAHAMQCFARLIRLLLGPDAINDSKLELATP